MAASASSFRADIPQPDPDAQAFWDAAREERFLIKRCADCAKAHFYPRPFCPHCWSADVSWEEASGRATLYTYSIVRKNDLPPFGERVPYVTAIVELEEGPKAPANIVDCAIDDVEIGMPLRVVFHELTDEFTIPQFRPA